MASKYNFELDHGVDNAIEITYAPEGIDFPLTGWTVLCQLRRTKSASTVDCEIGSAAGTIVINAAVLTLNFSALIVAQLSGRYTYDVYATNGSAKRRIVEGHTSINPATTRP